MAWRYILLLILFYVAVTSVNAQNIKLSDQKEVKRVVDSLASQLKKYYVLKPEAIKMSAYLQKRRAEGRYHNAGDPHTLAGLLTRDVLSVYHDEHFHVEYNPALADEISGNIEDVPRMVAEKLNQEKLKNFGFKRAEILNGNIGYLEISSFSRLNDFSKATADAALKMLVNSSAIVLDLWYGVGGSPDMVNYILGAFFKESVHFTDIYIRSENATLPYWTHPDSSLAHLAEIPVCVLTSYKTFSAAEGLAYALQVNKRATIIGEVTRGGAHTVTYRPLGSGFIADIPFGKAVNPVTKKNWEKSGVTPDIKVNSDIALETAETKIYEQLIATSKSTDETRKLLWHAELLYSKNHPLAPDSLTLSKYKGEYGAYEISYDRGNLYYQKAGKARFQLMPMRNSRMRPRGNDTFIVEFGADEAGNIIRMTTIYDDGRTEEATRTR